MRVLLVNPGGDPLGGAERSLAGYLVGLDAVGGVQVTVVVLGRGDLAATLRADGRDAREIPLDIGRGGGVRYRRAGVQALQIVGALPRMATAVVRLRRLVRATSADVVHSMGTRSNLLVPFLASRGVTTVITVRDVPQSRRERWLWRVVARHVDVAIASSAVPATAVGDELGIQVIDNPVERPVERDPGEARARLGVPEHVPLVANLAHFQPWKGQRDLLEAIRGMPGVHVALAGGDLYGDLSRSWRAEVSTLAASDDLRGRVHLLGPQSDVSWVYAAADVIAHCSVRAEAFGRTVVEAALARRALVASRAGAPGVLLRDGETALLYEPGDVAALRAALVRVVSDHAVRERLIDGAARWAADRFAPERHAAAVVAAYECGRSRRGRR